MPSNQTNYQRPTSYGTHQYLDHDSRPPRPQTHSYHYDSRPLRPKSPSRPRRPRSPSRKRRPRSNSRVRQPYTSNCARRRWPPSPKVEDEAASISKELSKELKPIKAGLEDDGVKMRGTPDQKPFIYEINDDTESLLSSTSTESSGPMTPLSTGSDNHDRRYVWKADEEMQHPLDYDGPKPAVETHQTMARERDRGRKEKPKLDTDFTRNNKTGGALLCLERDRSPYASGPRVPRLEEDRFAGKHMLSPQTLSANMRHGESQSSHSYYDPRNAKNDSNRTLDHVKPDFGHPGRPALIPMDRQASAYESGGARYESAGHKSHTRNSPQYPIRPSIAQSAWHASAMAYPGVPFSPSAMPPPSKYHQGSSDESDASHQSKSDRRNTGHTYTSTQESPKLSTPHSHDRNQPYERKKSSGRFSPTLPASAVERPMNRASLLNRDVLLDINSRLEDNPVVGRRASPHPSPRASPKASPTSSPYASPPLTPPNEPHHRRTNTLTRLKNEITRSRPCSPSPTESSPRELGVDIISRDVDPVRRLRPGLVRSRMTVPAPVPLLGEPEPLRGSGITIRSPSPARHVCSFSDGAGRKLGSEHASVAPKDPALVPTLASTLKPTGFSSRPRAASFTDARPRLSVETPSFAQATISARSPTETRSRPRSPSVVPPSDRYKPVSLEPSSTAPRATSPRPGPTPLGTKSRSYMPETTSTSSLKSSAPFPALSRQRSMPSAHMPLPVAFKESRPVTLPLCPRPKHVPGYSDWYTLHGCTSFAICPDCRHDVFGARYGHFFKHRAPDPEHKTTCDLNDPWIRIASLMVINQNYPDLELLTVLAKVTDKQKPCPESELKNRHWYHLEDPETRRHVPNFNVCQHCVYSLETIYPVLDNIFYTVKSHHHESKERICSLRSSGQNLVQYIGELEIAANEARRSRKEPDMSGVSQLAKKLLHEPDHPKAKLSKDSTPPETPKHKSRTECQRDRMFPRSYWHIHPHIPEFTVCPSCYDEVISPFVKQGNAIAEKFDHKPYKIDVAASCHLYSPRMRRIFKEACEDDDFEHLRHSALTRHLINQDLWQAIYATHTDPDDEEAKEQSRLLLAKWQEKE